MSSDSFLGALKLSGQLLSSLLLLRLVRAGLLRYAAYRVSVARLAKPQRDCRLTVVFLIKMCLLLCGLHKHCLTRDAEDSRLKRRPVLDLLCPPEYVYIYKHGNRPQDRQFCRLGMWRGEHTFASEWIYGTSDLISRASTLEWVYLLNALKRFKAHLVLVWVLMVV